MTAPPPASPLERWLAARRVAHTAESTSLAIRILYRRRSGPPPQVYAESARALRRYAETLGRIAQMDRSR